VLQRRSDSGDWLGAGFGIADGVPEWVTLAGRWNRYRGWRCRVDLESRWALERVTDSLLWRVSCLAWNWVPEMVNHSATGMEIPKPNPLGDALGNGVGTIVGKGATTTRTVTALIGTPR